MRCSGGILLPIERFRVQSFSQLFLPTNEMDEKNIEHLNKFEKLIVLKKQPPRRKKD
jgi:hypothetical protein